MSAPRPYATFLGLLLISGCGGQQQTASLRVVSANASEASINVLIDGAPVASNVTFLTDTGYLSVPAGSHKVTLSGWDRPPDESLIANFAPNSQSTLLFEGWGPFSSDAGIIPDDMTPASVGNGKLRIVDTTAGLGLDAFVLPAGTPPSGTPTFSPVSISENSPSAYVSLPAGSYHVVFTAFQTLNVQFDSGPIMLSAGQSRTLLLISNCSVNACSFNAYISMLLADLN